MPIKIPKNLPAFDILQNEGVMVMSSQLAEKQDIRPLKIILLNLMPEKIKTETYEHRIRLPDRADQNSQIRQRMGQHTRKIPRAQSRAQQL